MTTDPTQKSSSRRYFNWRNVRRGSIALACLATLIALAYTEEDWRGKRAWEQCKREFEAKGVVLDWAAFIPPPVPDAQNFFKAPGIHESDWVGRGFSDLARRVSNSISFNDRLTNSLLIAEVSIVPAGNPALLRIGESNAPAQARKVIESVVGPGAAAAQGFSFVARSLNQIHPAQIALADRQTSTADDLAGLFANPLGLDASSVAQSNAKSSLRIESSGKNSFRVLLSPPPEPAADYLRRVESFEPDFDAMRAALTRPYARVDGDYSQPVTVPIPKFQTLRCVAQTLADRTKCHLLLDEPDEALRDLTLLHGFYHVLEGKPTGRPMTLVAAMINVAIVGLYAETIGDGFRLRAWREPQLAALQQQLAEINLLPIVASAFVDERTSSAVTLENTPPGELFKIFQSGEGKKATWLERMKNPFFRFITLAPRGWIYQNIVFGFNLPPGSEIGDLVRDLVLPDKARRAADEISARPKWSPYSFLSTLYIPNASRAWSATARNQTEANEALTACALERYRIAHGSYPETLDVLAPEFIEKIPHDLIGGQSLHYRAANGTFLLYSVGWNEKDDGGQYLPDKNSNGSLDGGDWVWQAR